MSKILSEQIRQIADVLTAPLLVLLSSPLRLRLTVWARFWAIAEELPDFRLDTKLLNTASCALIVDIERLTIITVATINFVRLCSFFIIFGLF